MSEEWPEELSLDDAAGPASYLSPAARDALLQDVLAQAYPARKRGWWVAAAIALACVGGGSASAAVYWYARTHNEPASSSAAPARATVRAARGHDPAADAAAEQATPAAPANATPAADARTAAATAPTAGGAPVGTAPAAATASGGDVTPVTPTTSSDAPARGERRAARVAEDWLREGNRLRAARRWRQADQAYSQAARHTSKDAAYVAYVASAGVRLEHLGDARGALRRYRAALVASAHGPLDEEIRFGIADAYRALHERARERAALEAFLREHPRSPHAEQARARLR